MKSCLAGLLLLALVGSASAETLRIDFAQGLTPWEEKVFNGRVDYRIIEADGHNILQAESRGKASALIYWQKVDPRKFTKLRWRWKVERILEKGQAGVKAGDDYPARIYVIFDSWLPNYARSINYIWASRLEPEAVVASPYYRRSVMLAVESGAAKAGSWQLEERDLQADYRRIFDGEIPLIRAIALMSDGDDTGESARAWYDWIEFVSDEP